MKQLIAAIVLATVAAPGGAEGPVVGAPEAAAAREITPELLRAHVRFLASDLLEGRGPATRGNRLAEEYIQAQMEGLGLKPGAPGGGWIQKVPLVGIQASVPPAVEFRAAAGAVLAKSGGEFVAFSGVQKAEAKVENAEVVFVGYGIVAPEYQWDDYRDTDLTGKVLLMMNNDPESDPGLFAGRTRLWYGRWDYKYMMAAKKGAVGAIIIHTTPSAGYGWQVVQNSWSGSSSSCPPTGRRGSRSRPGLRKTSPGRSRASAARISTCCEPRPRRVRFGPCRSTSVCPLLSRTRSVGRNRETSSG